MTDRIAQLVKEVREMKEAFIELRGTLRERCKDHDRRLGKLENGTSRAIRIWGAILAITAAIFGTIVTAISLWNAH